MKYHFEGVKNLKALTQGLRDLYGTDDSPHLAKIFSKTKSAKKIDIEGPKDQTFDHNVKDLASVGKFLANK